MIIIPIPLIAIIIIGLGLLLGGSVAVDVIAGDNILPDSPLYGLEIAGENILKGVSVVASPKARAELSLDLAKERLEEMERLVKKPKFRIPEPIEDLADRYRDVI